MAINNKYTHFGISAAAVFTAMILVAGTVVPVVSQAFADTSGSGRATVVSISSPTGPVTFMDTGQLTSPGEIDATPKNIDTPLVTADGLLSFAMGSAQAESQSALGQLVLLPGNPNQITAYFATAKSVATCSGVSGYSDITSLTLGGQNILVTGKPNQVVSVPGVLTLTINEQIVKSNSITVNALHVHTALGADIIIASASSSVSCSTPATFGALFNLGLFHNAYAQAACVDFSTGGGWVKPPQNKGTFGFVAGYKNGTTPTGNFEFIDHTNAINITAQDVAYYQCGPYDQSRVFGGDASVNNAPGYCYMVYLQDNGEPGTNTDYFAIWEWASSSCTNDGSGPPSGSPYYATGNYLGGGNIEIHT